MKQVPLHGAKARGRVALVDDADYALVSQHRWFVREDKRKRDLSYAVANIVEADGKPHSRFMHVLIMGQRYIDHQDGNGLNNQRSTNLRPASDTEQNRNRRKWPQYNGRPASSQFKGVYWHVAYGTRRRGAWVARIRVARRVRWLGQFPTEEAAAHAYDDAARLAFGEFAALNFPRAGERSAL